MTVKEITKLALFEGQEIRKTIHNDEWWFSVADVVEALTDTPNATDYIKKMRKRDTELSEGWGQIVHTLSIKTATVLPSHYISNQFGTVNVIKEDYYGFAQQLHHQLKRW